MPFPMKCLEIKQKINNNITKINAVIARVQLNVI